jgi:prolipoprotein diacylglyceryltransferase
MNVYRTCVFGGVIAGAVVAMPFASRAGLTPPLWLVAAAFAICVALALAAITKVLFARETFTFLHYQLATLAATYLMLPAALDLLALMLAVAQAIGRIGCARAGCCHGRPARFGIRYGAGQVAEHWIGARVIPVQYLESFALFAIAIFTARAIGTPGAALTTYALSYACVRFATELLRGDPRRRFGRLSEAQWLCVVTAVAIAIVRRDATILVAAAALIAAAAAIEPRDVDAIARAVHLARNRRGVVDAPGLRISYGVIDDVEHYTLSVAAREARAMAALVRDLAHPDAHITLTAGNGVFHVVAMKRLSMNVHYPLDVTACR